MAMIKTASTSELAQRIHDAPTGILEDAQWVAETVWYTAGELRVWSDAEEMGRTTVSSGSARVYPGAGLDSGVHQYTICGVNQDQPSSARASCWEIDVELRGDGESEVEAGVAKLHDVRLYSDQSLDLSGYSSTVRIKESDGGYREDKSYSLSFASDVRCAGTIAENYIYAADSDTQDNVAVIAQPGSGDRRQREATYDDLLVAANQSGKRIVVGFTSEDKKTGYVFGHSDGVASVDMATQLVGVTRVSKISQARFEQVSLLQF